MGAAFALAALLAQDQPKEFEVEVLEVRGSVEFKVPRGEWRPLEKGARLKRGTMVHTGIRSGALLGFGKDTRVLVRSSTFAVIHEAFLEKNRVRGEVRLDVGSLHVRVNEEREEPVEFRVVTPEATAAVRGTSFSVRSTGVGTEAVSERGEVLATTAFGAEYRLGVHLQQLLSSVASDLAEMFRAGRESVLARDALSRRAPFQGDASWATEAFNPASKYNSQGVAMHPLHRRWRPVEISNEVTRFQATPFIGWEMEFDFSNSTWQRVQATGRLAGAQQVGGDWLLTIRGRPAWLLGQIAVGLWLLQDGEGRAKWVFNASAPQPRWSEQ